jgi:hypothetical protein
MRILYARRVYTVHELNAYMYTSEIVFKSIKRERRAAAIRAEV